MWKVEIEGATHDIADLQAAYGTESTYEDVEPVMDRQWGVLRRVVKITHPLAPDHPFYAIYIDG